MCKLIDTQLLKTIVLFALLFVWAIFSGGCWGGHYQWALTGLIDHGLKSVDEASFENDTEMTMVKTSEGYWVGQTEVTQLQFENIMGYNPLDALKHRRKSDYRKPDIPVVYLTAKEALSFCLKLTDSERAKGTLPQGYVYTLPTAKQWRAFVADAKVADAVLPKKGRNEPVYRGPQRVASLRPNRLGLFDVRGNVREYCLYRTDGSALPKIIQKGGAYNSIEWDEWQIDGGSGLWPISNEWRGVDAGFRVVLVKESDTE